MEIEKKFLIRALPQDIESYPHHTIEQAYLCTDPVLRIRKRDTQYILTYKGPGMLAREEHEFTLSPDAYSHLKKKADGNVITKTRYVLPERDGLVIELDIFSGCFTGLIMAEVEFPSLDAANAYIMPGWFAKEVTTDSRFHNSRLSEMTEEERLNLLRSLC